MITDEEKLDYKTLEKVDEIIYKQYEEYRDKYLVACADPTSSKETKDACETRYCAYFEMHAKIVGLMNSLA